jgi:four helix bundle protein
MVPDTPWIVDGGWWMVDSEISAALRAEYGRKRLVHPRVNPPPSGALLASMAPASSHKKLLVWQEAIRLVEIVYRDTRSFPNDETFGLRTQIRRSAVSVPSNIAEGAARMTTGELLQFLGIARGSLAELETQIELAGRLGFLEQAQEAFHQVERVGKLLSALIRSLQRKAA